MKYRFLIITMFIILCKVKTQAQISPSYNKIAVDVSTYHVQDQSYNYDSSFATGKDLGMSQVGLFLNWTMIEIAPATFDFSLLDIANIYYPAQGVEVDLNLNPINTNRLEVPSDLISMAFDNPVFINRYKILLDSIKIHIPDITLSSLVIGSEFDAYLGTNTAMWTQYTTFYDSVSTYAKTLWTGLKVAAELQFTGLINQNTFAQQLNIHSDYIGVSYYPLFADFTVKPVYTVPLDMDTIVNLYPSKPICFYQYGYPSSPVCNSSESIQSEFIAQTFTYWDYYATNIRLIDFTWITDLDTAAVNYYGTYYGLTDTIFLEFLRTIGLRTWYGNGSDKLALNELRCQAKQRGYNNLNINCTTGIDEFSSAQNNFSLYPNPGNGKLFISVSDNGNMELTIVNVFGQEVFKQFLTGSETKEINISHLQSGIYYVRTTSGKNIIYDKKLIISN